MKVKVYIFLAIYILSCVGIMLDFHYCSGKFQIVALYHADEDECCGEETEKTCTCCDDKYVYVDTDDSESGKKVAVKENSLKKFTPNYQLSILPLNNNYYIKDKIIPINHAPPNIGHESLFITNCIIRI